MTMIAPALLLVFVAATATAAAGPAGEDADLASPAQLFQLHRSSEKGLVLAAETLDRTRPSATRLSASGARCVSACRPNRLYATVPPHMDELVFSEVTSASTCIVDPSLSGHRCPHCMGDMIEGLCNGRCIDVCTPAWAAHDAANPTTNHHLRARKNIFDDIGDAFDDAVDTIGGAFADARDDIVDAFSDVTEDLLMAIGEQFNALPQRLQEIVTGAVDIVEATFEDLSDLGQDILSHLDAAARLTLGQIGHIAQRVVSFTVDNVRRFINTIDALIFRRTLQDFGCERRWVASQASVFVTRTVTLVGDITGWDVDHFIELGSLIKGVASGDVSKIKPLIFKTVLISFSLYTGVPPNTVEALGRRAISVLGTVSQWDSSDWRAVGGAVQGLSRGDWMALTESEQLNEVSRAAIGIELPSIAGDVVERGLQLVGGPDSGNERGWQSLAQFAVGFTVDQLGDLGETGIRALSRFNIPGFNPSQLQAFLTRTIEVVGMPETWNEATWRDLGEAGARLAVNQLRSISIAGVRSLGRVVGIDIDHARAVFERAVELIGDPTSWSRDDWLQLGYAARGIASDVIMGLDEVAIRAISKVSGLSPASIQALAARAKQLIGSPRTWSVEDFTDLGNAVAGLLPQDFSQISADAIEALSGVADLDINQIRSITSRAVELFGPVTRWSVSDWRRIGTHALQLLSDNVNNFDVDVLRAIGDDGIVWSRATLMSIAPRLLDMIGGIGNIPTAEIGNLVKALSEGDIRGITQPLLPYLRDALPRFAEDQLCPADAASPLDCSAAAIGPIGDLPLCNEQSQAVGSRLREIFGEVNQWAPEEFQQAGELLRTLSPADTGGLSVNQLQEISELKCMAAPLVSCLVKRAIDIVNDGEGIASWNPSQLIKFANQVSGFDPQALRNITGAAFRDAVRVFSDEVRWSRPQLFALGELAVRGFGRPSGWSSGVLNDLGGIVAGISEGQIQSIPTGAFTTTNALVFERLCDEQALHVLSDEQLYTLSFYYPGVPSCPREEGLYTPAQLKAVQDADTHSQYSIGPSNGEVAAGIVIPIVVFILIGVGYVAYTRRTGAPATGSSGNKGKSKPKVPKHVVKPKKSVKKQIAAFEMTAKQTNA